MIRFFFKTLAWTLAALVLALLALLAPVAYVELACRPQGAPAPFTSALAPEWHRPAARTLLTYPEWHVVYAYEDYAAVIGQGDPHDFGYLRAVGGFWGTLCDLSQQSGPLGGFPWATKQMVYTVGVSFTAEMLVKAAYEETLGRAFAALRGPGRAGLDDLSAQQAAAYGAFLHQTPWYRWDFAADAAALAAAPKAGLRDRERAFALGLEARAKAAYAQVIAAAVAGVGADALRLRAVVTGRPAAALADVEGLFVLGDLPGGAGVEVEAPRYAAFTALAQQIAAQGGDFAEIAGNDQIMVTLLAPEGTTPPPGTLAALPRQGRAETRFLVLVPVADLAAHLREDWSGDALRLEHIYDY